MPRRWAGREYDNEKMKNMEIFIRTFHNGDYDTELDNSFSIDRSKNVTLPDRPTHQASYKKPDNWAERNQIGLVKMKRRLQSYIDSVSHHTSFELELTHNTYRDHLMDNEEPIVWHDAILDEYWNKLEAAIDRKRQLGIVTKIEGTIHIENVEMSKERLATLVTTLSGQVNIIVTILFNNTNLCEECIVSLFKLVDVSSNLTEFCLHHNQIDNMDSARCISKSLKSHDCINSLKLTHCDLGSSTEILLVILQSDISFIDLRHNNIDSLGAVTIAEYLGSDPPIKELSLHRNRLNDDDSLLISQALKRNTNLRRINLLLNNITSIGVKALLTCAFDSSSLNAISESNHTLTKIHLFSPVQASDMKSCINSLLEMNRVQKIVLALQDKDSLLQYLANIPVELIPEVLAFPH